MPWKECKAMSERVKFVARLSEGERMTDLCKEFGISRKTGYKLWSRYQECGNEAFVDQSRRPKRYANETAAHVQRLILDMKDEYKTWGAPKIREHLMRRHPGIDFPARSTVHAILERNDLVKKRKRVHHKASGTNMSPTRAPNDLWCADYKGEFRLGNKRYCYPLTLTDHYSRFILCCDSLESTRSTEAVPVFKRVFSEYGVPKAIRTDNGAPFASRSYYGLSKLSVLWLKLGIKIERIKPGNPQQNGRHERMHKTLKADTTKPAATNHLQQQEKFDEFVHIFNTKRPHEALDMNTPASVYKPSKRTVEDCMHQLEYPNHDKTYRVSLNGQFEPKKGHYVILGKPFATEMVGVREVDDGLWKITFADYDIAYYDFYDKKLERIPVLDTI